MNATLALSAPPIMRMALKTGAHAAVSAPIFPSTGVPTEAENPAVKIASKPRNQRIKCSAPSLPANGNR